MNGLWIRFSNLFSRQPNDFERYVREFLRQAQMDSADVVAILIDTTRYGQSFAHVILSNNGRTHTVLLILDEMHRGKPIVRRSRNCPETPVIESKSFKTEEDARKYARGQAALYRAGTFTEE